MFERFSSEARNVVVGAQAAARRLGHHEIRPEHLLIAMLDEDGTASVVLREHSVDPAALDGDSAAGRAPNAAGLTDDQVSALETVGIDVDEVVRRVEEAFGPGAFEAPAPEPSRRRRWFFGGNHIPFTAASKKILELSLREALSLKHRTIGAEHILLGLLRAASPDRATDLLRRQGVTHAAVRARVIDANRDAA